ncbi:ABC transporter substrate-binding protein [Halobacteriales archaeon SW_7_71_33]|nr:MAG: ABC transporter substrate-binding protein [Halobacteriales archaeon SW_7_71_33]
MSEGTSRRRFLVIAGSGTATAVAGCTGGSDSSDDTGSDDGGGSGEGTGDSGTTNTDDGTGDGPEPQTVEGGTLQTALVGKVESLDPIIKGSGGVDQWGESLMGYENGVLPPTPALAEDVEVINAGERYRFTLKEGVTFHDGSELTASDVVYCWERVAQSENSQNADDLVGSTFTIEHEGNTGEELSNYVPGSLGVSASEEYVFEVDMQTPYFGALFQIASESTFVVYPENTVGDIERDDVETEGEYAYQEAFGTENGGPKAAGTGPFEIDTWSKGDRLVMTRFDEYHGETATVDAVEETILADPDAAYQRAVNGNLNIFQVPSNKFDVDSQQNLNPIGEGRLVGEYELEDGRVVNHAQVDQLGTDVMIFNTQRVPEGVRKAFAAMLNQHDIARNIYPNQKPAYTMTPPQIYPNVGELEDSPTAQEAHVTEGVTSQTPAGENGYPWGYDEADLQRARRIAEEAGVTGNSYTLTITSEPEWQTLAGRIQQKAESIGIQVNIETADYGTLISQGIFEGKLDMYSLGDTAEVPSPDNLLRFYPPQVARRQATKWGPTDVDNPDPDVRSDWESDLQQEIAQIWAENYQGNTQETEQASRDRARAYLAVEEGTWSSVQILPTAHRVTRTFWSQDLDYTPPGVMGDKTHNTTAFTESQS